MNDGVQMVCSHSPTLVETTLFPAPVPPLKRAVASA